MIEQYKSKKDLSLMSEILFECNKDDFYFTKNNIRIPIIDTQSLLQLIKESHHVYFINTESKKGLILVWKSFGGDKERKYIKLIANNDLTASDLITFLLWNYDSRFFVKIKKDSIFLKSFREKGFKFSGGRGNEILLIKEGFVKEKIVNV